MGLVFQYPEYQLFEETVAQDVAFGPKNLGLSEAEIADRVEEALELVGLDYEDIKDRSPFDLSGVAKEESGHCRRHRHETSRFDFRRTDCWIGSRRSS